MNKKKSSLFYKNLITLKNQKTWTEMSKFVTAWESVTEKS